MIQHVNSENKYKDLFYANPFRYRGYYYDEEIELYYLQSRYYAATLCRFINSDIVEILGIANFTQNNLITNLYIYCDNNITSMHDKSGFLSEQQLANMFCIETLFLMFLSILAVNNAQGLVAVGGYVTKIVTPIAAKGFWWKPWLIPVIVLAAVTIVVGLVWIVYSDRKKEIDNARKRIPNKLLKNGKVDLSQFGTKLPNGQGNKGPDDWKIVKDVARHATKKWKLYKAKERIASLLEDGTIYGK